MNILEELYYGNISPSTMPIEPGTQHHHQVYKAEKIQADLLTGLTGKERALFLDFLHAQARICDILSEKNFILGFRLGAQFTTETLHNPHEILTEHT